MLSNGLAFAAEKKKKKKKSRRSYKWTLNRRFIRCIIKTYWSFVIVVLKIHPELICRKYLTINMNTSKERRNVVLWLPSLYVGAIFSATLDLRYKKKKKDAIL
ncbi:hypothetical protein PUN28_012951 [Cardiocondyla obscurior]|uniref:Uncharacterized protein n=1 Tax=Cardiocondyla obscurior TaxID=286306 RepID=A0AAW2F7G2_9HYME